MSPRRPLAALAAAAVSVSGLAPVLRRRWTRGRLAVLMYHGVVDAPPGVADWCFIGCEAFRAQVAYLKRHFRLLALSEASAALDEGGVDGPAAVLTFDDGFRNNCDAALPVLREFDAPATVFLTTDLVGTADTVWFCRLLRALARTRRTALDWGGARYDLSGPAPKAEASARLQALLKRLPKPWLDAALSKLCARLGVEPGEPVEEGSPYRMLDSGAVREMLRSGLVEFGAHTRTHAVLSLLPPEAQRREIEGSLGAVRRLTGRPCALFAYPNGGPSDYDAVTLRLLARAGVRLAATSIPGVNGTGTPRLELRRYPVGPEPDLAAFELLTLRHLL